MDRRLPDHPHGAPLTLRFEGSDVQARQGESVAVALFASGARVLSRSVKYHRPRGFFCLDGSCGACLMRIDGRPNVKACRTPARQGLECERQNAFPSGTFDLLGAADFFFPRGMDHHTMMTSPRALNTVMQKIVRQLAGLGRLPDESEVALPSPRARHVELLVIGAGPAGLAAATAAARGGRRVLLIEEQERAGGSLLAHPAFGIAAASSAVDEARAAGVELLLQATAFGWYPEDRAHKDAAPGLLAVATADGLLKLTADRYLYATGAYDQNALFVDNDRPGVMSARAVGRLLVRFGIKPAERPVVVGGGPYAQALSEALTAVGAEVTRVDGTTTQVIAARGHSWVKGLDVVDAGGKQRRLKCDLVAVAALPAPASDLPRQHGVAVELRAEAGGFACVVDGQQRTRVPAVFACGDVTGFIGPDTAAVTGARAGVEAARP